MQPKVEARIVQELALQPHETVYEVGTGSRLPHGAARAPRAPRHQRGDPSRPQGARGREPRRRGRGQRDAAGRRQRAAPARRRRLRRDRDHRLHPDTAASAFLERLAPGGRLFAVLGDAPVMKATLVRQPEPGSHPAGRALRNPPETPGERTPALALPLLGESATPPRRVLPKPDHPHSKAPNESSPLPPCARAPRRVSGRRRRPALRLPRFARLRPGLPGRARPVRGHLGAAAAGARGLPAVHQREPGHQPLLRRSRGRAARSTTRTRATGSRCRSRSSACRTGSPSRRPTRWCSRPRQRSAQAQQDLAIRAAQAYFDVLLARDNVALSESQKAAIDQQLAQAKRNFEVGTATIVDTLEAQARYDQSVAKEISDKVRPRGEVAHPRGAPRQAARRAGAAARAPAAREPAAQRRRGVGQGRCGIELSRWRWRARTTRSRNRRSIASAPATIRPWT